MKTNTKAEWLKRATHTGVRVDEGRTDSAAILCGSCDKPMLITHKSLPERRVYCMRACAAKAEVK